MKLEDYLKIEEVFPSETTDMERELVKYYGVFYGNLGEPLSYDIPNTVSSLFKRFIENYYL